MTRIQRARALRLGYILASLLWAGAASARPVFEPVSRERAVNALGACDERETGYVERWEGGWRAVCSGVESGAGKYVNVAAYEQAERCEAKADLDYALAERINEDVGVEDQDRTPGAVVGLRSLGLPDPDASWEDSYAACLGAP